MSAIAAPSVAQATSSEAATALFERYRPRVFAFCLSRTRNRSDAEDATQTTFVYALTGLRRGVVPEFELSWLLRIAENVCHSQRRRAHRRYERDELPVDLAGTHAGDPAVLSERRETIMAALEELPETQRRALVLREWHGLSYHDIAAELQTSHAAVETLLFRARRSLAARVASFAPPALQLVPAAGRLVRWALGTGAGKATVVAVSVATVGVGVSADDRLAPVERPTPAHVERAAAPDAVPRPPKAVASERTTPVRQPPASPPTPQAVRPSEEARSAPTASRDPSVARPTAELHEPSTTADLDEARPLVGVEAPLVEVEAALEPVEAVLDPVEEALAPAIGVVAGVEQALPTVPVVDQLPAVELPPALPKLP